ncbi:MAG: radical SAM protein [Cyanobacteria bacterium REEB67]|nr:radical SAM protein [Cyanobacteria bacterium REEB67]
MFPDEKRLAPIITKQAPDTVVGWYFPNSYEIGMSGLGYQLVWWLLEQDVRLEVKRGFLDQAEAGIEASQLIGFTVSWELDFINILNILKKHDIPAMTKDRGGLDQHALVFGGGPVLSANPEPFADFFDVILLGDAEAVVPAFAEAWQKVKDKASRQECLRELAKTPGIYVPSLYEISYEGEVGPITEIKTIYDDTPKVVAKQVFATPDNYAAHTQILSSATAWSDTFLIEIVRSCPQECRFCLASFLTRPFRATTVDTIMKRIEEALRYTKRVGLLGPSVTEHPHFQELADRLLATPDIELTIASVRADTITAEILDTLHRLGQRSVTIAIESGSERLRSIMKKNLSEAEILSAVDLIDKSGLKGVKFYGIVGLPHETQNDLEETVRLLTLLKKKHRRLKFVFGVSSFVPKAQTPYQWEGRDRDCAKKLEYLRKNLAKLGIEMRPESLNWSDIQALISRGDRRLNKALLAIADSEGNLGAWKRLLRRPPANTPGLDYYAFRRIPAAETLPWSHLVDSNRTDYLQKHAQAAALEPALQ